jgi:hypothetical protein
MRQFWQVQSILLKDGWMEWERLFVIVVKQLDKNELLFSKDGRLEWTWL